MAWEWRGRNRYFYQPVRAGGQPRRLYWGAGEVGRLHELLTVHDRRLRAKRLGAMRARLASVAAARRDTRSVVVWVRQLVRAARLVGGQYQHRGQWRWRAGRRLGRLDPAGPAPARVQAPVRPSGFTPPSPFIPEIAMTLQAADTPPNPTDLGRHLTDLNDRANRGDRSALAELEEVLDCHPIVWQTAARLSADTAAGWARLLGDGGAVTEVCLRREMSLWKAGLAGPEPTPLVTAAVDAAGVVWLAQRFAERELFATSEKKRVVALRQLAAVNRQVQDALKLVMVARGAADVVANRASADNKVAAGPRLFDGATG
jgi:hypothetical protein